MKTQTETRLAADDAEDDAWEAFQSAAKLAEARRSEWIAIYKRNMEAKRKNETDRN